MAAVELGRNQGEQVKFKEAAGKVMQHFVDQGEQFRFYSTSKESPWRVQAGRGGSDLHLKECCDGRKQNRNLCDLELGKKFFGTTHRDLIYKRRKKNWIA